LLLGEKGVLSRHLQTKALAIVEMLTV